MSSLVRKKIHPRETKWEIIVNPQYLFSTLSELRGFDLLPCTSRGSSWSRNTGAWTMYITAFPQCHCFLRGEKGTQWVKQFVFCCWSHRPFIQANFGIFYYKGIRHLVVSWKIKQVTFLKTINTSTKVTIQTTLNISPVAMVLCGDL